MEKHIVQVVALHDTNHIVPEDIRPVSRSLTASTCVHFYKSAFFRPTGTHRRYRRSERPSRFFWQEGAVPAARYAAAAARHSPKMAAQKYHTRLLEQHPAERSAHTSPVCSDHGVFIKNRAKLRRQLAPAAAVMLRRRNQLSICRGRQNVRFRK